MKKDETGVPGHPYIGKKGPRKTPPRDKKAGKRNDAAVKEELFTEERKAAPTAKKQPSGKRYRKKVQLGYAWSDALRQIEAEGITMAEFVATLTPEELARGRLKNADGTFRGAPAHWVPAEFHKECVRELMRRGKTLYQENYIASIEAMTLIATNPAVEPKDRIKAAQFVIERIEGKVPERLEIGTTEPWQELLAGVVATVDPNAVQMRAFSEATGERSEEVDEG